MIRSFLVLDEQMNGQPSFSSEIEGDEIITRHRFDAQNPGQKHDKG